MTEKDLIDAGFTSLGDEQDWTLYCLKNLSLCAARNPEGKFYIHRSMTRLSESKGPYDSVSALTQAMRKIYADSGVTPERINDFMKSIAETRK